LHRKAEIAAMKDVPEFINKARQVYGYDNFINDAGGSLCELEDREVLECLADQTLIVYIKASERDEKELIERAETSPKPMYYQEVFLDEQLQIFMQERKFDYVAEIDPNEFVRWVFPRLFYARIPRYESIAAEFGYTVSASAIANIKNEEDFISMLTDVLEQ
jgi:shikimate kinase